MEIKIKSADGTLIDATLETKDGVMIVSPVCEEAPKPKRWRDDEDARISGFFIGVNSVIVGINTQKNDKLNRNIFATEKQAKSALAMARISQIMANDERFGGIVTDEEWLTDTLKYMIAKYGNFIDEPDGHSYSFLAFHTKEQRDLFLAENEDLIRQYLMFD